MNASTRQAVHTLRATLVTGAIPLFLGALLSDWAYASTYEVQWIKFASWLIAGALVFTGLAVLWVIVDAFRTSVPAARRQWVGVSLLAATFLLGFLNALTHGKDGWAAMPLGLILSIVVFVLAVAAAWSAHRVVGSGERT
jgi:uncharacterized membrane protein